MSKLFSLKVFFAFICAVFFFTNTGGAQSIIMLPDNLYLKDKSFRYYSNVPTFNRPAPSSSKFAQAVIVIHGSSRSAEDSFDNIRNAAVKGGYTSKTLIIAPQFYADDADELHPSIKEYFHYWSRNSHWKQGELSHGSERPISSFEVVNQILRRISENFSSVKNVVITGNSAGAQFTQRYAAFEEFPDKLNFQTHYVLVNGDSYMYLNQERYSSTLDCPVYNNYKYGLDRVPSHLRKKFTNDDIRKRILGRHVILLIGVQNTQDYYLDISCEAQTQGEHRYERGLRYYDNIKSNYPENRHRKSSVYDIGHSARLMYESPPGISAVFRQLPE